MGITAEVIPNKSPHIFAHLLDMPWAPLHVHLYLCLRASLEAELAGFAHQQQLLQAGNATGSADFQRLLAPRWSQGRSWRCCCSVPESPGWAGHGAHCAVGSLSCQS